MNDAARIVADEVRALEDKTGVASILRWRVGFPRSRTSRSDPIGKAGVWEVVAEVFRDGRRSVVLE
jgi:hypothetical protein